MPPAPDPDLCSEVDPGGGGDCVHLGLMCTVSAYEVCYCSCEGWICAM
jgi:hypothetical protein